MPLTSVEMLTMHKIRLALYWVRLALYRMVGLLPCCAITSRGGQFQWRWLRVTWINTLPAGCQLLGPPYWGRTSVEWVSPAVASHRSHL